MIAERSPLRTVTFWLGLWLVFCAVSPYLIDALPQYDLAPSWWLTAFMVAAGLFNVRAGVREARRRAARRLGCTEACSEHHTFSWPCELAL